MGIGGTQLDSRDRDVFGSGVWFHRRVTSNVVCLACACAWACYCHVCFFATSPELAHAVSSAFRFGA